MSQLNDLQFLRQIFQRKTIKRKGKIVTILIIIMYKFLRNLSKVLFSWFERPTIQPTYSIGFLQMGDPDMFP